MPGGLSIYWAETYAKGKAYIGCIPNILLLLVSNPCLLDAERHGPEFLLTKDMACISTYHTTPLTEGGPKGY
jgi:hypothetical protein